MLGLFTAAVVAVTKLFEATGSDENSATDDQAWVSDASKFAFGIGLVGDIVLHEIFFDAFSE